MFLMIGNSRDLKRSLNYWFMFLVIGNPQEPWNYHWIVLAYVSRDWKFKGLRTVIELLAYVSRDWVSKSCEMIVELLTYVASRLGIQKTWNDH